MTRALFQLIWREEFEAVFGETMTAEERHRSPSGDTQPVPVPFQVGDGVASQLRLIAQRQLKEKIQAEKKAERVAKIERWRGKKQVLLTPPSVLASSEWVVCLETEVHHDDQVSCSAAISQDQETQERSIRQ